jgi:putative ABC transport system ATP-binding protein
MQLIRDALRAESGTALIATHDLSVQGSADRVLHIEDGRLVKLGQHAA